MGPPRRKDIIASRRRVEDDGEEEEGSVAPGVEDDSLSEGSAISDADDDADAEGSDASEIGIPRRKPPRTRSDPQNRSDETNGGVEESANLSKTEPFTAAMTDTEVMMNGLKISEDVNASEGIDFEDLGKNTEQKQSQGTLVQGDTSTSRFETLADRRRREHEEYKKKRDADPAFVPNRGGFFMHDHRSSAPGQNGFRPSVRGRGKGRGGVGNPFSSAVQNSTASGPADAPWAHDLHESVVQPETAEQDVSLPKGVPVAAAPNKPGYSNLRTPPPNRSFSRSVRIGNLQIRVFLAGMENPIVFSAVPVNQHTRLPHHRPPLRRDKPVRISIPDFPPRYIFPAMDRSFIFIPRALRPNQQGFGRGRGRGSFSSYAGLPSRRTSAYGGSNYSPSAAMSRRSSVARVASQEGVVSPAGSSVSRTQVQTLEPSKPIVRLPPSIDLGSGMGQPMYPINAAPMASLPLPTSYSLPQNPLSRENRPEILPMHQPRPQKTVSVADIESPATLNFQPPPQQQQLPFHHQVPLQVSGQTYPPDPNLYPHSRHPSHPSQASGGTPLSQIPERAIHAQPFQPYPYQQPAPFYPQPYPPPVYYFPPAPMMPPSVAAPAFVPGQQYPFVVPTAPLPAPPETTTQPGTVAQERDGMVYYYDSSQLPANTEPQTTFTSPAYAPPASYLYPQPTVYYPPQ